MKFLWRIFFLLIICSPFSSNALELDSLLVKLRTIQNDNSLEGLDQKSIYCNSIAIRYQDLSDNKRARIYFLQSVAFTEQRISRSNGWDDPQNNYDLAYLYKNLAVFESSDGNEEQAKTYLGISEKFYKKLKTALSPEEYRGIMVGFYESNFVNAYHANRFEEAEFYILKVRSMLSGQNPSAEYGLTFRSHGELYAKQERYEEAEALYFQGLEIYQQIPDSASLNWNQMYHSIFAALYHSKNYQGVVDFGANHYPFRNTSELDDFIKLKEPNNDYSGFLDNVFIISYADLRLYRETKDTSYLMEAYRWQKKVFALAEDLTLKNGADRLKSTLSNPKNKVLGIILCAIEMKQAGILTEEAPLDLLRVIDVYHSTRLHLERISYQINAHSWKLQKQLKNQLNLVNTKIEQGAESTNVSKQELDSLLSVSYKLTLDLDSLSRTTKKEKILDEYRIGQTEFKEKLKNFVGQTKKNILTYFYEKEGDSLFIIGMNADTNFVHAVAVGKEFSAKIRRSYDLNSQLLFRQADIDEQAGLNRQFYKWLIAPVKASLNSNELLIYPIGEMSYISFDAFLNEEEQYLVNDYNVQYTTSLFSIISNLGEKDFDKNQMASFYPSDYGTDSLAFLLNAQQEVEGIENLLGSKTYSGEEASKSGFLAASESNNLLHIASHSVLNFENPHESFVIFDATDSLNENRLFAYEIFALTLNADLVTLSSCNSAKGEIEDGIGVVSLSNAFYYAGVPITVSSLWSAQDKSSAEIMIAFYENLANGNSKSESLRNAKLTYLKTADKIKKQPFFWANYVVYGVDTPLYEKSMNPINYWLGFGMVALVLLIGFYHFRSLKGSLASSK